MCSRSENERIVGVDFVNDHRQAQAEAPCIAILADTMCDSGCFSCAMKVKSLTSSAAPIYSIVLLLALGFGFVVNGQAPADDDSPARLGRQIVELYHEGKYKEAIPLAEKLVVVVRRAKGDEHPDTARSLNNLAALYQAMGDYAKAEPLDKEALEIRQKVLGRDHLLTAVSLNDLAALYLAMGDHAKADKALNQWLVSHRPSCLCLYWNFESTVRLRAR